MKKFEELTKEEQGQAVTCWMTHTLKAVCEGAIVFNDEANGDDIQARIEAAAQKAEQMQTPWFTPEYIMDDDVVRGTLLRVARANAEDSVYLDEGQMHMSLWEVHEAETPTYIQEFLNEEQEAK